MNSFAKTPTAMAEKAIFSTGCDAKLKRQSGIPAQIFRLALQIEIVSGKRQTDQFLKAAKALWERLWLKHNTLNS